MPVIAHELKHLKANLNFPGYLADLLFNADNQEFIYRFIYLNTFSSGYLLNMYNSI